MGGDAVLPQGGCSRQEGGQRILPESGRPRRGGQDEELGMGDGVLREVQGQLQGVDEYGGSLSRQGRFSGVIRPRSARLRLPLASLLAASRRGGSVTSTASERASCIW